MPPSEGALPYAYAPWSLYLFLPWALLPWNIAWIVWRAAMILLFGASVFWAYDRRPLGTAVFVVVLGPSIAANFDTGNVNVFIALAIWLAFWVGPRAGRLPVGDRSGAEVRPGAAAAVHAAARVAARFGRPGRASRS